VAALRRSSIQIAAAAFLLGQALARPCLAEQPADTERLLKVIEEQQRRLDAQEAQLEQQKQALEAQLEQQKQALEALREQVEALRDSAKSATKADSSTSKAPESAEAEASGAAGAGKTTAPPPSAPVGFEGLEEAAKAAQEQWPGSFGVPGTDTRMKIGGFAELDVVHDTNDVGTPTAFLTQAIRTRGPGKDDGQTSFSVQATRIGLETRTPLDGSTAEHPRRVTTYIEADFFDNVGSATPEFRFRQGYGEVVDFFRSGGNLLLGQTWSTYTNLYAIPSTLEFWGPNTIFGARNPMVRWIMPVGEGLELKLAAEAANLRNFQEVDSTIDPSDPAVDVENRPRWPDGVVALGWEHERFNLSGAFLARDLHARTDEGNTDSAFGWGATLQGRIGMPDLLKDDFVQFSLTYGEGIGSLFNDFPPDAAYDVATDELKPIETLGLLAGYQHWWSPQFYSLGSYGWLQQDNRSVQAGTAYHETMYASLNVTWTPDPRWMLGPEVVYGSRKDKDGRSGSNVRTVLMGRFNF